MATVALDRLVKRFAGFTAVNELTLDIADCEFLVLLGPSGCGKTTTMRMVAGLDEPTSGDILIDGKRVNDRPARDRDLAMVFQNYGLYPHMTVAENIGYPLKVRGLSRAERDERVRAAAARVELGGRLDRRPAELSGGQRQRVALARAIVRTPKLFLMDEPLSNLDAKLRTVMRAEIKHLQRELETTTIYVTHDQVEAMTLADRIVVMEAGRIRQTGAPAEIYARPTSAFVAGFIGSPPMNLLRGRSDGPTFAHDAGSLPLRGPGAGEILLGVRPEDVRVSAAPGDFTGTVYSSELLGDVTLLGIALGTDRLVAKVGASEGRSIGETVAVTVDRGKLHAFDATSGDRLAEVLA